MGQYYTCLVHTKDIINSVPLNTKKSYFHYSQARKQVLPESSGNGWKLLINRLKHKYILVLVTSLEIGDRKTMFNPKWSKCDIMHHSKKMLLLFVQCLEMLLLILRNTWRKSHLSSNTRITDYKAERLYTNKAAEYWICCMTNSHVRPHVKQKFSAKPAHLLHD